MLYFFLTIAMLFCAFKWLQWKIATAGLLCYMEMNHFRLPTESESKESMEFALRNMIKDLVGLRS